MTYSDCTINDRNALKRWVQRRRYSDAVAVAREAPAQGRLRVLDFGAGNGELVRQIAQVRPVQACVFEPAPHLMQEAVGNLRGLEGVSFVSDTRSLDAAGFDCVFCLEVFEHLPEAESERALAEIDRLVKPGGVIVIGVPHEIFLPALVKGVFRMTRRYGQFDATVKNVLAAARGRPPSPRPVAEIAPGVRFHFEHMGFDYRSLWRTIQRKFLLEKVWFSPLRFLGPAFNSEVYFVARKAA